MERGPVPYTDRGGASRFFFASKASGAERWFYCRLCQGAFPQKEHGAHEHGDPQGKHRAAHPCVKPQALMRWLVRLIAAPGSLVLDPFCGTGSTGEAALAEGCRFLGIDQDAEYVEISRRRLAQVAPTLPLEAVA